MATGLLSRLLRRGRAASDDKCNQDGGEPDGGREATVTMTASILGT